MTLRAFLLVLLSSPALGAPAGEVEWRVFLAGHFRPGHFLPFELEVGPSGSGGEVRVFVKGEFEARLGTAVPGSFRAFHGNLLPQGEAPEIEAVVGSSPPRRYADRPIPLVPLKPAERFLLVLGDSPGLPRPRLDGSLPAAGGPFRIAASAEPERVLPRREGGLEPLDLLVLGRFDAPFSQDRGDAVASWIRGGGRLLIGDGAAPERLGFLENLLWPGGSPRRLPTWPSLSPEAQAVQARGDVVYQREGESVVLFRRGEGSIVLRESRDAGAGGEWGDAALRAAWAALGLHRPRRAGNPSREPSASVAAPIAEGIFGPAEWPRAQRATAARIVASFAFFAGLVLIAAWRFFRRPLAGLAALAAVSLGCAAFLGGRAMSGTPAILDARTAFLGRGGESVRRVFSLARITPVGEAALDLDFLNPEDRPRPAAAGPFAAWKERALSGERPAFLGLFLAPSEEFVFSVERSEGEGLDFGLVEGEGGGGLRVVNRTRHSLQGAWLLEGGRWAEVGDLPSGGEKEAARRDRGPWDLPPPEGRRDANWMRRFVEELETSGEPVLAGWIAPADTPPEPALPPGLLTRAPSPPTLVCVRLPRRGKGK